MAAAARPDERNGRALAAGEWRARSGEDLAPAGERHRLAANIAALEVLRSLEDAGRPPTAEEQAALARWSAWGSLPKVFDPAAGEFATARAQVEDLLGDAIDAIFQSGIERVDRLRLHGCGSQQDRDYRGTELHLILSH